MKHIHTIHSHVNMARGIAWLLLACLPFLSVRAQDFQPGDQAQNLTEHKNVTVDYSTGILHYTVPIFTLKSGDYTLPLSLDYIAQGVKGNSTSGILGYNWTLNTGGIVTRTMRGGFPDESSTYGYLYTENSATPLIEDQKNVGLRKRDGECDIFTAVFNGQKADFIIRRDSAKNIYADPLEYTDARIECETQSGEITGWTVTDNDGNRYVYRQQEMNTELQRVDISTVNAIAKMSYTSAWHLTRILPYNGAPIEFYYKGEVENSSRYSAGRINVQQVSDSYKMTYRYGRPIKEPAFDFDKFKEDYTYDIEEARRHLTVYSHQLMMREVDLQMQELERRGHYTYWLVDTPVSRTNARVLGILTDLKEVTGASRALENALLSLAEYCEGAAIGNSSQEAQSLGMAGMHLRNAAKSVCRYLGELKTVSEKEISGGSRYNVSAPILSMIASPERIVKFTYEGDSFMQLSKIGLYTWDGAQLSAVSLAATNVLSKVTFLDKEDKEVSLLKFNYFGHEDFPSFSSRLKSDLWGFCTSEDASEDKERKLVTMYSLKHITLADGGEIGIEYERNKEGYGQDYGGIRLKSLIFNDGVGNRTDTVSYGYPSHGVSVYASYPNVVDVHYPTLTDKITYDRVRPIGYSGVNMGNNGLYYPRVTETVNGRGMNVYTFSVTCPPSSPDAVYPFWLNGLPTGKAVYDAEGNLLRSVRYSYRTLLPYNKQLPQLPPSEYYLDEKSLRSHYLTQNTEYISGEELYQTNIEPRLSPQESKRRDYVLGYGGRTVLEEEEEYRLDENIPYSSTMYDYDNSRSAFPNRITRTGSDGYTRSEVCKRVVDMADGVHTAIDKMKQSNRLSPRVKERTVIDGQVIAETVWQYQESGDAIVPVEALSYLPESPVNDVTVAPEPGLFTYGESNYVPTASYGYARNRVSLMPVSENGRSEKRSRAYDGYGNPLLTCDAAAGTAVTTVRSNAVVPVRPEIAMGLNNLCGESVDFLRLSSSMPSDVTDERFLYFLESREHHFVVSFVGELAKSDPDVSEARTYYDLLSMEEYRAFNRFKEEYERFVQLYPGHSWVYRFVEALENVLKSFDREELFEYLYLREYRIDPSSDPFCSVSLAACPDVKRMRLYVLGGSESASVSVTHAGGTATLTVSSDSPSSLRTFDIDLSAYTGVERVSASLSGTYMALVPEGAEFEAVSYNKDGTVRARFDQDERLELYTYDAAGRVTRVEDRHGNLLKTYEYNHIINH